MATALLLCVGMLVIPLVALAGGGATATRVASRSAVAAAPATTIDPSLTADVQTAGVVPPSAVAPETTDGVAAPPTTAATRARSAGPAVHGSVRAAGHTARVAPAPTVPSTTTTAAPRPSQTGPASWYDTTKGTCAHKTLPFGTVVTITDLDNGNTATCTVEDRGPYEGDRIIDLAPDVFSRLAPTSQGVINVRISW